MKKTRYILAAAALAGLATVAGCGGGSSNTVNPFFFVNANPTLRQFAYVATNQGIEMFPLSATGTVAAPTLQTAGTLASGVSGLAVLPSGLGLVAVTGTGANTKLDEFTIDINQGTLTQVGTAVAVPNLRGAIVLDAIGNGAAVLAGTGTNGVDQLTSFTIGLAGVVRTGGSTVDTSQAPTPVPVLMLALGTANGSEVVVAGDAANNGGNNIGNVDVSTLTPSATNAPTLSAVASFQDPDAGSTYVQAVAALGTQLMLGNNILSPFSGDGLNNTAAEAVGLPPSGTPGIASAGDQDKSGACLANIGGTTVGVILTTDDGDPEIFPYLVSGTTITNFTHVHKAGDGRVGTNISNLGVDDPNDQDTSVIDNNLISGNTNICQSCVIAVPPAAASGALPTLLVVTADDNGGNDVQLTGSVIDVSGQALGAGSTVATHDSLITTHATSQGNAGPSGHLVGVATIFQ